MQFFLSLLLVSLTVQLSVAPPVTQNKKEDKHTKDNEIEDSADSSDLLEYRRYLTEVVETLETDPDFRAKLEKADEADIRTGKIAEQLAFVSHNIRTKLDELKRTELERLRHLFLKESELLSGLDAQHPKIPEHVDHTNTRTFEIQDLKKLIEKTTKDLAEADIKRREEFKQHEMEVKYEEEQKLKSNTKKSMNDSERKKYEEELKAIKEKHKQHEPVHHPGSKQQLEEVWEKQDHMESEDFNPRTFFFLHDVDGNGVWDQDEVKALFLKELDKLYAQGATHEELLKRTEEMERMREHVFNEADVDKDGFISYDEFLEQTKNPDFQQDEGWQPLDEQQIYTQEEFEAFEKHKQEELQRMIAKGMPPPHPGNVPDHQEPFPPHGVPQAQYHPQQAYPHQVPVEQVQMSPQQQYHPQMSQHQMPQAHLPDQQYQPPVQQQQQQQLPGQMPGQQPHPGVIPLQQQQQHPGVVPVQQHPGAVPVPQQQHPGAVPVHQQQQHPGVVPVQQHQQHPGAVPVQQQQQHPGQVVGQQTQQHNVPNPSFQQHPNTQNQIPQSPQGSNTH